MRKTIAGTAALTLLSGVSLQASIADWKTAATIGVTPAATYFIEDSGSAVSGAAPQSFSIGDFDGSRSFELIVNAGNAGVSSAVLGLTGVQALKFEQYDSTGMIGITNYGVADHISTAPSPLNEEAQLVFTSDGADTLLYVNGELAHTFTGVPLQLTGTVGLGAAMDDAGGAIGDRLDGHILGFTSYASVLTPEQIETHYQALIKDRKPVYLAAWQAAVGAGPVTPAQTLFQTVSGMAPALLNVGELDGPRTFEFITYAGDAAASGALMGRGGVQGLKFEQWNNSGTVGLTGFGVADYDSGIASPFLTVAQVAYVSDGANTDLYINGALQYTFEGAPLSLTGYQGLGAAGNITEAGGDIVFRDPLEGQVLRFASYDRALTEEEVTAHYTGFAADAGAGNFTAWQTAVAAASPTATRTEPAAGADGVTVDVGPLTGDRTFEFVVNSGISTANGTLLGGNAQALKYEQWNDTGMIGMTNYGVADYTSPAASPDSVDTHIVYSSDGTDTTLYVDGVLQHTFTAAPLTGAGLQGLATAAGLPVLGATYFDPLDGHILGFASYADALTPAALAAHYKALTEGSTAVPPSGGFQITAFSRDAATGAITLTWPSAAGETFSIKYGTGTADFTGTAVASVPASAGNST
ncbi:MAG: hypothetical protein EOP86_12510, partial [Verrucomicrobiaceae bacterium]